MTSNDLFFILMNTSLKGQARFPAILLPRIQLFQISIHSTVTFMNKKMSFKSETTKPTTDRGGETFGPCKQLVIMQSISLRTGVKADEWNPAPRQAVLCCHLSIV